MFDSSVDLKLSPKKAATSSPSVNTTFVAVMIGLSAAHLFCGYEFIRSTSNTLYKDVYGQRLPQVMVVVPFAVVAALCLYSRLLSWLGPRKTLLATSLLSSAGIFACYGAIQAGATSATFALYVLRETYIVLLVEQYWSFLNSSLGDSAAKKLYGPICGIGSLGAIAGGLLLGELTKPLGKENMLLFAAGAILPAALFSELAYRRCGEPVRATEEEQRQKDHLGLRLFGRHRMLIVLLLIIIATQMISVTQDWIWQGILSAEIPDSTEQNQYSGRFFALLNAAAFVGQFFITPLLLRFVPLLWMHIAIPLVNLAACATLFGTPSLATAGAAYLLFKTMDYSIFRAAKEILYIPFPFDVRYRAKEIIDVFGYRFGKGALALPFTILAGAKIAISGMTYAVVAGSAAIVWVCLAIPLVWFFRRKQQG
ncbi:MAG: Npt1/Npt2 family nucleotide transporter [Planctomycetota bacterium]